MTPIRRLGFFAYAMLHLACFVLITLHPILPWGVAFAARSIGAMLIVRQFFHFLDEAIKDR